VLVVLRRQTSFTGVNEALETNYPRSHLKTTVLGTARAFTSE
jgi:hypothetical protein